MGPPTHTQGSPRLSNELPFSGPCLSRQGSTCFALAYHVGRGRRPPPSQLPTHTVARPDPPLVRSQAERSQAVALPHSLPRSPSPQAHTPLQPLGGPVHRRPHQGAWGVGGPEESRAPRQEERRGERCVGAAEGPARVHVTRQGHGRHGQGKKAPPQDPPALDDHRVGLACLVMWRVSAWWSFVSVASS
jgi:hypothetical protein